MKQKRKKTQTPEQLARAAYRNLAQAVEIKWYNAAPRVRGWEDTLTEAFAAHFAGKPDTLVALPAGATAPDGATKDAAGRVLEAFDAWLGRDAVSWAIQVAAGSNDRVVFGGRK